VEALCPKCQVHYGISQELLDQGGPINCPNCQVELMMVQPGTDKPLDAPSDKGAQEESPVQSSADNGFSFDSLSWSRQESETPNKEDSTELQDSQDAALESESEQAPEQNEEQAQPEQAPERAEEQAQPEQAPERAEEQAQPEQAPEQAEEQAQTEQAPEQTEEQAPEQAEEQAQPEQAPEQAEEQAQQEQAPEQVQPASSSAVSSVAPSGDSWAEAAAKWAASGFAADQMPSFVREKDDSEPAEQPTSEPSAGLAGPAAESDDVHILTKPSEETPRPTSESVFGADAIDQEQSLEEALSSDLDVPSESISEKSHSDAPSVPPPIPKISEPSTQAPPPLESHSPSAYVMKGTGEDGSDSAPWTSYSESESAAVEQSQEENDIARFQLPSIAPEESIPYGAKPSPVQVAKPSYTWLWITLIFILLGAVGYTAWFFYKSIMLEAQEVVGETSPKSTIASEDSKEKKGIKKKDSGQDLKTKEKIAKTIEKKTTSIAAKKKKKSSASRKSELALISYNKGNKLIREKNFKKAVEKFRNALKLDPKLARAHRGLGIAYAKLKERKKACRSYRSYLKALPPSSKEVPALKQILKQCK
jgi:hypothetical protein